MITSTLHSHSLKYHQIRHIKNTNLRLYSKLIYSFEHVSIATEGVNTMYILPKLILSGYNAIYTLYCSFCYVPGKGNGAAEYRLVKKKLFSKIS